MKPSRSIRRRLPQRRRNETFSFQHRGIPYRATIGYYENGEIGEIFLAGGKLTSAADVESRDAAILLSFALQFGCPFTTLNKALTRTPSGQAEGVVGTLLDLLEERTLTEESANAPLPSN